MLDHKPIIVFTTQDGQSPYIGLLVDKVEDNVRARRIKALHELALVQVDPQTKSS